MTAAREVVIVDLGLGNLRSVVAAFQRVGAETRVVNDAAGVRSAQRIVVPGQGAFRDCATVLAGEVGRALRDALERRVPYFGICLGMQALFEGSAEAPGRPGLGWFRGTVVRFDASGVDAEGRRLKVPHMGWNEVTGTAHPLPARDWFYFVHSYHCVPTDPSVVVGTADHGGPFVAAVARDHVFAVQFHPEKSAAAGEALLRRFVEGGP